MAPQQNADVAIGRNKGNKDKVVRRRITPSLTFKIVSGNKVVDLNNLELWLPYMAYALT